MKHSQLTSEIISAFFEVYRELGYGFLEPVYQKAMATVCRKHGLEVTTEFPIRVNFRGKEIGYYKADLVINDTVVLELKAVQVLCPQHRLQILNYLRATKYELGLLPNFGPIPQIKRFVFDNAKKRR